MLPRMAKDATRISQPGGTGNVGALRIVKAAQWTLSSVDPDGRRSVAASSRNPSSLFRSSTGRTSPPVSMRLCAIETGGANLAQCQALRGFDAHGLPCKSPENRLAGTRIDFDALAHARSAIDAKSIVQGRHVETGRIQGSVCPAVGPSTAARSRDTERARPALEPAQHLAYRGSIRTDTSGASWSARRRIGCPPT